MHDATRMLDAAAAGDPDAAILLFPLVYDELRKLAAHRMAAERPDHSLDATALVHEAYLKLVGDRSFANRGHFFAAAAEAMRRILIDRAREQNSLKRGGDRQRVPLADLNSVTRTPNGLLAVNETLERFERKDPKKAELVKLRFFAGLTMPEVALAMDISLATAERWWTYAKAWLFAELSEME